MVDVSSASIDFPDRQVFALEMARRSMREYLNMCVINCQPVPRPFGDVAEEWQWRYVFDPIIPLFERLCLPEEELESAPPYTGPTSFFTVLPRGSDKTSAIARAVNYLIVFCRRRVPLQIAVAAAAQQQAKFLRNAMQTEKVLNPWFGKYIEIYNYEVRGPGGTVRILSADAGSAYGAGDDVIITDEITHWRSNDLWVAMMSGTIKRRDCVSIVLSNAGYVGTWQWDALKQAESDQRCVVHNEEGYKSGWVDKEQLEKTRSQLIASTGSIYEASRLIDNIWISSRMGACFLPDSVETMRSPDADLPLEISLDD